jgi:hypothetical protein
MYTSTSLGEEILVIAPGPTKEPRAAARRVVVAWIAVGVVVALVTLFASLGVLRMQREWLFRQCSDQLKRLGRAMHAYNDAHGNFPAPAIFDADGTPLLSWRVALLPQLGYQSLYDRFRLDEPWDSPHNRALLAEMPREFGCPAGLARRAGLTGYKVLVGPANDAFSVNTLFEPKRGADIRHITDGTSNTILVLETEAFTPWTKPEDLHWAQGGPLPGLRSPHRDGAHALFADGLVRHLRPSIRPEFLLAFITMNGGEALGGG